MKAYRENPFVFSGQYRLLRHLIFWMADILIFTAIFRIPSMPLEEQLILSAIWTPLHMVFAYPIIFLFIPRLLLKERYLLFALSILLWFMAGWFWNYICRAFIFFDWVENNLGLSLGSKNPWAANSYLSMMVIAGLGSTIVLFKYWMHKQKEYLNAQNEKISAELQLLKAQIHPHFLFNTLNNIYSFALHKSEKTPAMIAKLSSLLSYVLYDCKSPEVSLEKEIEIMKNYIDLEKERYGNSLDVSINIEGDIGGNYIAPLLLLPFIENAFKHGTSEQLEKAWLSMDISVKQNIFRCKVVNSKNDLPVVSHKGIGIENVKKRLSYLYPGRHELRLDDEGHFFAVSLMLDIAPDVKSRKESFQNTEKITA